MRQDQNIWEIFVRFLYILKVSYTKTIRDSSAPFFQNSAGRHILSGMTKKKRTFYKLFGIKSRLII
jgi:hypothetical protein